MIDSNAIKKDFPLFGHRKGFVYLDSTATSLKPQSVIDSLTEYYSSYSANIFRGVYDISERATKAHEDTRIAVRDFIGAMSEKEIIFTRNATESINLFVHGISHFMEENGEIATSIVEHHSNFVPWQQMAQKKRMSFKVMANIESPLSEIEKIITRKTKVLALTSVSNVLGSANPIKQIITKAKKINPSIITLIDGAQAVPHNEVDVKELGCDAYVFSSHKMLGPTGVGVLWVRKDLLETLSPYQYGGEMIRSVSVEKTEFANLPHRFEAGTPHIAGVIALKEAIRYLQNIGLSVVHKHEVELAQLCADTLESEFKDRIRVIGPKKRQSGIVSFSLDGVHAHDVAQLLNEDDIAVRAGHHCAMPLHTHLGMEASVRASFYLYNSQEDIQRLVDSLQKALNVFK